MGFTDHLEDRPSLRGKACAVLQITEWLDDDEVEAFQVLLGQQWRTSNTIADIYRAEYPDGPGPVSPESIQRHRRGACRCGR